MKFSYQWLKELSGSKLSAEKMAELLTMKAFEVEMENNTASCDISEKVVIGKIVDISKHPNADKLQLVKVNVGDNILDIVCGAWNIKLDDIVPVALPGAKMPGGMIIREAEIRGQKSSGMLCAEDELGLGEDHSGIKIMPKESPIGTRLIDYFSAGSRDTLDIKILPDRAHDAMSHAFMAREIAAIEDRKTDYDFEGLKLSRKKGKKLDIKIENPNDCRRYIGVLIEGVKIVPSPRWLAKRLESCGVRSINNVVDVTNYIMLELGSPIHAFDVRRISGEVKTKGIYPVSIRTRKAKSNEEIRLLDGCVIKLSSEDLLITGKDKPLALAGIMGGEDSGIDQDTQEIVLEFANFDPVMIRKSRMRLGLKTEASDRFEKDLDPNLAEKAAVRTIEMILHLAGGKLVEIADVYPKKIKPWSIKLEHAHTEKLLGEKINTTKTKNILESLGIKVKIGKKPKMAFECVIPTERLDIITAEDLIEEIGRIWGYEKVDSQPIISPVSPAKTDEKFRLLRMIKNVLAGMGFDEMYNYAFYSSNDAKIIGLEKEHVEIINPITPESNLFSASLIPNLIKNASMNLANFSQFKIFEMGKVYSWKNNKLEQNNVLGLMSLSDKIKPIDDFQKIKGEINNLINGIGGKIRLDWKMSGRKIIIEAEGKKIGYLEKLDQGTLLSFHIKRFTGDVYVCELDIDLLAPMLLRTKIFQPILKFPSMTRDISFQLSSKNSRTVREIEAMIRKAAGDKLMDITLFDVYEKEGEMSYAYRLRFGSEKRTLKGEEVDEKMIQVTKTLDSEGFQVRK